MRQGYYLAKSIGTQTHGEEPDSLPPDVRLYGFTRYAPLAQLVEHLTLNQGVQGSSP